MAEALQTVDVQDCVEDNNELNGKYKAVGISVFILVRIEKNDLHKQLCPRSTKIAPMAVKDLVLAMVGLLRALIVPGD